MSNSDSPKSPNLQESKEKKADISKEIDTVADDAKKSKLNESNTQVISVLRNSNKQIGKCELFDRSVVFDVIRSLYVI